MRDSKSSGLSKKAEDFVGVCSHLYEYSYETLEEDSLPRLTEALLAAFSTVKKDRASVRRLKQQQEHQQQQHHLQSPTKKKEVHSTNAITSPKATTTSRNQHQWHLPLTPRAPAGSKLDSDSDSDSDSSDSSSSSSSSNSDAAPPKKKTTTKTTTTAAVSVPPHASDDSSEDDEEETEPSNPAVTSSPPPAAQKSSSTLESEALAAQIKQQRKKDVDSARERPGFILGGGCIHEEAPKRHVVWKKINGKNVRVVLDDSDSD